MLSGGIGEMPGLLASRAGPAETGLAGGCSMSRSIRSRVLPLIVASVLVGAAAPDVSIPQGTRAITCTNPASGATWQIAADLQAATMDANPAQVSATTISWRDGDGRNYSLDRQSGELTVIVASSTGGYFIHDRCQAP
jgi:hypothetical protein